MNCNECGYKSEENKIDHSKRYIIIYIIGIIMSRLLPYLSSFLYYIFGETIAMIIGSISRLGDLLSLIAIVTGKIKYPQNKIINVLFWVTIAYCIFFVVFAVWLMWFCANCNMPG